MESFLVRALSEDDLNAVVASAGGRRAHPDADKRDRVGADYVLAEAIVELKSLDEEGLKKPIRQRKLAELFRKHTESRPVVVIDREVYRTKGSASTTASSPVPSSKPLRLRANNLRNPGRRTSRLQPISCLY